MRVLLDYHHNCLWHSMELLADRLGWTLYRPIGMEWWDEGYNNHDRFFRAQHAIEPIDAIARQYLEPWGSDENGLRRDSFHGRLQNLLTLEQARDLKPDIVISSLAHNHEGFARFASEVGATFGLQIGNVRFGPQDMAEDRWDLAAFGLVSGFMPVTPPKPHVVYHQEFSLVDFQYMPPVGDDDGKFTVSSFVQCYPQDGPAYDYWQQTAPLAPELRWNVYGAYGEAPLDQYAAGNLDKCASVGTAMQLSDIGWHAKRWSDGYGHVFHNWHAVGRPMFGFYDYYKDQMGGALWIEGETAWDIGSRSPHEVATLLRAFRDDPEFHERTCRRVAENFRNVVSFDEEEQAIRRMFEAVLP